RKNRSLTTEALEALREYPWPGNVRELKNLVERLIILTGDKQDGLPIQASDVLEHLRSESSGLIDTQSNPSSFHSIHEKDFPKDFRSAKQEFEKEFILRTLRANDGNISKTAQVLGLERSHLSKKIKSCGVDA